MKNMDPVMKLEKDNNYLPWSRNFENDNFFSGTFPFREIYNPSSFSALQKWIC